jgi:hypothetical protein
VKRITWFLPFLLLAGCSLPSISPEQRAYTLVAGVNAASRDLLADSFLPTITDYATLRNPAFYPDFWEQTVPMRFPYLNAPYSVTAMDASNPAAVTMTLADSHGTWGPRDLVLVMAKIGNDWFIQEVRMDPSPALPPTTVIVQ